MQPYSGLYQCSIRMSMSSSRCLRCWSQANKRWGQCHLERHVPACPCIKIIILQATISNECVKVAMHKSQNDMSGEIWESVTWCWSWCQVRFTTVVSPVTVMQSDTHTLWLSAAPHLTSRVTLQELSSASGRCACFMWKSTIYSMYVTDLHID